MLMRLFFFFLLRVIHTIREQQAAKKWQEKRKIKTKSGASTAETVRLLCIHDIVSGANERRRVSPRARGLCKTSGVCFLRITRDIFFFYHADDRKTKKPQINNEKKNIWRVTHTHTVTHTTSAVQWVKQVRHKWTNPCFAVYNFSLSLSPAIYFLLLCFFPVSMCCGFTHYNYFFFLLHKWDLGIEAPILADRNPRRLRRHILSFSSKGGAPRPASGLLGRDRSAAWRQRRPLAGR